MAEFEPNDAAYNDVVLRDVSSLEDTDAGNAEAFELLHGHRFRFDHDKRKWLVWNERYWSEDRDGEINRAALSTAQSRLMAAVLTSKPRDNRDPHVNWALKSQSVWRIEAMLRSAQSIRSLATRTEQYDSDPYLLTVANGTLDLRTGALRPSRPDDLITRASQVTFDPNAAAPRWLQFVNEIFAGDVDLVSFIQRAVGYSLTGDTKEQCFFILHGNGANGKSTFVETVSGLLGTHAETAEFTTFLARRNTGSPRNDLARLHASRFVKASEGDDQAPLAEAIIKELTGEDSVTARFLFHEHFTFKPQFKIWLITNHRPEIRGTDNAIWRRVRLIPFCQHFEGAKKDPNLRRKLIEELPGILNWAVQGSLDWQRQGLGESPQVVQATQKYRQESDVLGRFLKERCFLGPRLTAPAQRLFQAYVSWCNEQGEKAEASNVFARGLNQRGITKKRTRRGNLYQGVELSPSFSQRAGSSDFRPEKGR